MGIAMDDAELAQLKALAETIIPKLLKEKHDSAPQLSLLDTSCYMSFAVLRHLQYQVALTQKISIEGILDELAHVQASILVHKKTGDRYRLPGNFSARARKIYKAFNMERCLDVKIHNEVVNVIGI